MDKKMDGKNLIITISQGLTANIIPEYNKSLDELLPSSTDYDECILNLANTNNIDSTGVTFVINTYKKIKSLDKSFSIIGANEDVQSLFRLMKLDKFFEMKE